MITMSLEQAKALLSKTLKEMTPEEKKLIPLAIKIVGGSWANV